MRTDPGSVGHEILRVFGNGKQDIARLRRLRRLRRQQVLVRHGMSVSSCIGLKACG
ncbi:hypothetical protein [Xanthomonas sp. 3075]|uniref:hypothetical protein n=1 Tax=Xanthomonas sp. 3075 TaxID=3035315 RepID=UPI00160851DC|nr:hypothetical protein [Xanthomonas sp. 3075]MBB4133184.1 hypothetical protein [Xanthomonas sp. 3075]